MDPFKPQFRESYHHFMDALESTLTTKDHVILERSPDKDMTVLLETPLAHKDTDTITDLMKLIHLSTFSSTIGLEGNIKSVYHILNHNEQTSFTNLFTELNDTCVSQRIFDQTMKSIHEDGVDNVEKAIGHLKNLSNMIMADTDEPLEERWFHTIELIDTILSDDKSTRIILNTLVHQFKEKITIDQTKVSQYSSDDVIDNLVTILDWILSYNPTTTILKCKQIAFGPKQEDVITPERITRFFRSFTMARKALHLIESRDPTIYPEFKPQYGLPKITMTASTFINTAYRPVGFRDLTNLRKEKYHAKEFMVRNHINNMYCKGKEFIIKENYQPIIDFIEVFLVNLENKDRVVLSFKDVFVYTGIVKLINAFDQGLKLFNAVFDSDVMKTILAILDTAAVPLFNEIIKSKGDQIKETLGAILSHLYSANKHGTIRRKQR